MAEVSPFEEQQTTSETTENGRSSQRISEKNESKSVEKVPYYKLFWFADAADYALMVMGVITSVGSGLALPLMTFLYGELANSFGHNVETQALVDEVSKIGKLIQLLSSFVGGFVIAFARGWLLTLVLLSVIPVLVVAAAFMTIVMARLTSRGQTAYSEAALLVEQTISSIRTVASFTGERRAVDRYEKSLHKAYKAGVQEGLVAGLGSGVSMSVLFCSYALAVWFGSKMIIDKGYTGGHVLNIMMAVLLGSFSLGQISPCLSAFSAGQVAAFKIFETIHRKPDIDPYSREGRVMEDIHGEVELRDVDFSYPSRPDERIFSGFSLRIESGTKLALVGESGSGKSTILSLVERFYDPQGGEVLIDGVNIREFQVRWMRGKIGLVSQEPVLFASSIKDNIAYGKEGASLQEIRGAAELAHAAKFITNLPQILLVYMLQGIDTMVGVNGTQLSGGQKQRIALARAILKDPRILLLDEATGALDAKSERIVQDSLDKVMINRTTIIVAHSLTTIKNADSIAVIHKGKIVEKGSHSELIQNPEGAYTRLIQLQELDVQNRRAEMSAGAGNSARYSFDGATETTQTTTAASSSSIKNQMMPNVSLYRLALLNKPEIPQLILGSLAAVMNGAILPLFGLLFASAINSFYHPPHQLRRDSKFWAGMFVVLGVASLLVTPTRTYLFAVAGCRLIKRLRLMCFEKVAHMEIGWFDVAENSSSSVGLRLSADVKCVRNLVGESLALVVQNVATAVAGLVIGFQASWQLSLIVLVMLPLIALYGYVHMKFIGGFSGDSQKLYEDATQVASDGVGNIRTVASFCAEEKMMELHRQKCRLPVRVGTEHGLLSGAGFGMSIFFLYSVYAASYYAGARLVHAGNITFEQVFRVFIGLSISAIAISQSGALAPDTGKAKAGAASIFELLDRKSAIDSSDNSGMVLQNIKGDIQFQNVRFRYPSRPDVHIFTDLCLTIHSGKSIAIVGESGSGKSTIISLLQRFYDPDSGVITLDNFEIKNLNLKWLRKQMGVVSQEPVLFNDTIRANIAYGYGKEGDATEAEILAAAQLANAHKFISALQKGYDTIVGERGIQLSGGQKQRVAIARAIMKDPKIMLLDEATSALDAESEKLVQRALDRAMIHRTTIVVAHRLSTIKNADFIAVIRNGVVAEKGNHQTLIHIKHGIYASLKGGFNTPPPPPPPPHV
ncbi:ABC transporter B family member 11-like isoform X3 [Salvia miltiorrhiza]|uniref:ABC transporter B family member 11-like isoform X3 n=1 Tax=Salvia miltiorrhiza TaxID=226208 RepID=UPI0025ACA137|nr:ABC transporter B family member 11-like isoform X3 [Salvia miltiorrhiza]